MQTKIYEDRYTLETYVNLMKRDWLLEDYRLTEEQLGREVDHLTFDSQEVILDTEDGRLTIRGSELHVNRLTVEKGEVDLEGQVDSLIYSAGNAGRESLLSRLFG